jgi:hypothetical protein
MSLQKTTFIWSNDVKNKENELQSSAMEKENEEQLFKEYYKNAGITSSCTKK